MKMNLRDKWGLLDTKTKLMALGTIALFLASICLSFSNFLGVGQQGPSPSITVEEGVEIPADAEPIEIATEETRLVTSLVDIVSNQNCQWRATNDPICALVFTEDGFIEYNGDIATSATVEFYSIEATENGRAGTWRVTFDDGSVVEASFQFVQNLETGLYVLSSTAFPTHQIYQSEVITSEDVLAW